MKRLLLAGALSVMITGCGGGGSSSGGGVADTSQAAGTYTGTAETKAWAFNDPSTAVEQSDPVVVIISPDNRISLDFGDGNPLSVPVSGGPSRFTGSVSAARAYEDPTCTGDLALEVTADGAVLDGTLAGVATCEGIRLDLYQSFEAQRTA